MAYCVVYGGLGMSLENQQKIKNLKKKKRKEKNERHVVVA